MVYTEHKIAAFFKFYRERHVHTAGVQDSKFSDDPHIASFRQKRNLVAFLQSERHKSGRNLVGIQPCLLKCSFSPFVRRFLAEKNVRRKLVGIFLHEIDYCQSLSWHICYQLFRFIIREETEKFGINHIRHCLEVFLLVAELVFVSVNHEQMSLI